MSDNAIMTIGASGESIAEIVATYRHDRVDTAIKSLAQAWRRDAEKYGLGQFSKGRRHLSESERNYIIAKMTAKQSPKQIEKKKPSPTLSKTEDTTTTIQNVANDDDATTTTSIKIKITILDAINYSEIFAAWIGSFYLLGWVGLVIGLPIVLFYFDAISTVKNANSWQSSQFAIVVTFLLTPFFGFVHYNTVLKNIETDSFDAHYTAIVVAVIASGISFAAILQSKLKKEDGI